MTEQRLTKDEIAARYTDEDWRRAFIELTHLVRFLENCIIGSRYRIPDEMNAAIHLTEYGKGLMTELTRQDVAAKEARLMCLLEMAHLEPLVDVLATDVAGLRKSISNQIRSGDLSYPFVFGRELYDRAAELFTDSRVSLSVEDTANLLDGTSQGVFQIDNTICGPLGLTESLERRRLAPTTRVPLFSCADPNCREVHLCLLATDWDAPINDDRRKLTKLLRQDGKESSEWDEFVHDLTEDASARYDDFNAESIPFLLGDCLADSELRSVLLKLLDAHESRADVRDLWMAAGIPSNSSRKMLDGLSRAEMLQLAMIATDRALMECVDLAVSEGAIKVPIGEIRRPVVNRNVLTGRFLLQSELGYHGVRLQPFDKSLANLRLRRLVDRLFEIKDPTRSTELEWQLRTVNAPSIASKLDQYLRTETPRSVIERLVLATRANVITACTDLSVDEHRDQTDDELVNVLLWKLGFSVGDDRDAHAELWAHHERMEQIVRTAGISPLIDQDDLRARGVNYFVKLEEALEDALAFTTWALTYDHYSAHAPFQYTPDSDQQWALTWLQEAYDRLVPIEDSDEPRHKFNDAKMGLYTLSRGFGILADALSALVTSDNLRSEDQYPRFHEHTVLQVFPFKHVHAFLDLTEESQRDVITRLRGVTADLLDGKVSDVRNEQLHFRRSVADLEKLQVALSAARRAIVALEESGFVRLPYVMTQSQTDIWGRATYILTDPRGRDIAFVEPTAFDWLHLPAVSRRQYVMTVAQFAEPNGFLRFRPGFDSEYARMWSDFPRRRRRAATLAPLRAREEARSSEYSST